MLSAQEVAAAMGVSGPGREIQVSQTGFRMRLVEDWKIPVGAKVLEIGCGQGDTTAVLADAVGPDGHVMAVDIADPSYGAPSTLGESSQRIKDGPLGDRIEFRFQFDVLDPANAFENGEFDYVVLAHCTWYFESLDRLRETLTRIRPWTRRLCLSEWDLAPVEIGQLGHLLAVWIQGQVEAFKPTSLANVRSPYSREALHQVLSETGWRVSSETVIDSSGMADGRWEVAQCLSNSLQEAKELEMPPKLKALTRSFADVLRRVSELGEIRSLPAYSIVAERIGE